MASYILRSHYLRWSRPCRSWPTIACRWHGSLTGRLSPTTSSACAHRHSHHSSQPSPTLLTANRHAVNSSWSNGVRKPMSWPISTGKSGFPVITTQPNNIGLVICGWTTAAAVYSTNSHPPKPPPFQKTKQRAQKLLRTIKDLPVPKENIYTLPNLLTFTRLVASPFIGYLVVNHQYGPAILGCALFGLTDALDGFIARRFNMKSVVGSILDPAADKALMTVLTVSLAMSHLLPWWLASIILLRDGGLVLAAFYYRYISLPPPKTLSRYFDFSLPSAEVHPTTISKVNTMLQLGLMLASLGAPLLEITNTVPLTVLQYTVATTTILSGISYLRSKNAVRILTRPPLGPSKPPSP